MYAHGGCLAFQSTKLPPPPLPGTRTAPHTHLFTLPGFHPLHSLRLFPPLWNFPVVAGGGEGKAQGPNMVVTAIPLPRPASPALGGTRGSPLMPDRDAGAAGTCRCLWRATRRPLEGARASPAGLRSLGTSPLPKPLTDSTSREGPTPLQSLPISPKPLTDLPFPVPPSIPQFMERGREEERGLPSPNSVTTRDLGRLRGGQEGTRCKMEGAGKRLGNQDNSYFHAIFLNQN